MARRDTFDQFKPNSVFLGQPLEHFCRRVGQRFDQRSVGAPVRLRLNIVREALRRIGDSRAFCSAVPAAGTIPDEHAVAPLGAASVQHQNIRFPATRRKRGHGPGAAGTDHNHLLPRQSGLSNRRRHPFLLARPLQLLLDPVSGRQRASVISGTADHLHAQWQLRLTSTQNTRHRHIDLRRAQQMPRTVELRITGTVQAARRLSRRARREHDIGCTEQLVDDPCAFAPGSAGGQIRLGPDRLSFLDQRDQRRRQLIAILLKLDGKRSRRFEHLDDALRFCERGKLVGPADFANDGTAIGARPHGDVERSAIAGDRRVAQGV